MQDIYPILREFTRQNNYTFGLHHRDWNYKKDWFQLEQLVFKGFAVKWKERRHTFYKLKFPQISPDFPKLWCSPCSMVKWLPNQRCKPCYFAVRRYILANGRVVVRSEQLNFLNQLK